MHDDAGLLHCLKAGRGDRNSVNADAQVVQAIAAGRASRSRVDGTRCGVRGGDGGTFNGRAGGIEDGASDGAAVGLGEGWAGRGEKEQRHSEESDESEMSAREELPA